MGLSTNKEACIYPMNLITIFARGHKRYTEKYGAIIHTGKQEAAALIAREAL
jgi:hypothetical protein